MGWGRVLGEERAMDGIDVYVAQRSVHSAWLDFALPVRSSMVDGVPSLLTSS